MFPTDFEAPLATRALGGRLKIARASGAHLWDSEGQRYVDLGGSSAVANIGHCHPRVVAAVQEQAAQLMHSKLSYLSAPRERYLEQLHGIRPRGTDRVAFTLNGSDANVLAVRLAQASTRRSAVAVFQGGYHGRGPAAAALGSLRRAGDDVFRTTFPVHFIAYPDLYRPPLDGRDQALLSRDCLAQLERVADPSFGGGGPLAAVLVEPIQAPAGVVLPPPGFLAELRSTCDRIGALLIVDEVQTGFGRTGTAWCADAQAVEADLVTFGKGIGGGLPAAGVFGREDVMTALPPGAHGGTMLANAVNMAAGAAAIEVFRDEQLDQRASQLGERARRYLDAALAHTDVVGDIRGAGLLIGIDLVLDRGTKARAGELAASVARRCQREGVLVGRSLAHRNVLKLAPPLTIDPDDLDQALACLVSCLTSVSSPS